MAKYELRGKWYTPNELSEICGIPAHTIRDRLRRGYTVEEAVKLFLQNKITYPDIYRLIESALEKNQNAPLSFESLELTDKLARATVLDEYRRIKC